MILFHKKQNLIIPKKQAGFCLKTETGIIFFHFLPYDSSCELSNFQPTSSMIRFATNTPLAEACDSECVTPLPSPIQ